MTLHVPDVFKSLSKDKRSQKSEDARGLLRIIDRDPIGIDKAKKWMKLMEQTLSMYAWLMKPTHPPHTVRRRVGRGGVADDSLAQTKMRSYMRQYKDLIGSRSGNGLKIPKFHQLLHYERQILKDGSILNIDTGIPEAVAARITKKYRIPTLKCRY